MKQYLILLLALSLVLTACSPSQVTEKKEFSVAIYNLSHSHTEQSGEQMDKLSFIVENQEIFPLDCSVLMIIDHPTEPSKKKGALGILEPGETKPGAFTFVMPDGDAKLDFKPVCKEI